MKKKMILVLCLAALSITAVFGIVRLSTKDNDNNSKIESNQNSNSSSSSDFDLVKLEKLKAEFEGIYTSNYTVGKGTSYYVSQDGSDSNNGTSEDKPFQTVSQAIKKADEGDTIIIRKGVYSEQININKSGTKEKPITIKSYEGEDVIFDYSDTNITEGIKIDSKSYINIDGIKICNITESSSTAIGISISGASSNITIKNCEIYNIKAKSDKGNAHAVLVAGSSREKAINSLRMEENYVHDCILGWSEAISVNGNVENCDIINNKVKDVTNIGIDIIGGEGTCSNSSLDQARNIYVAGNIVSSCDSTYARSAGIYADGSKNVWINGNIIIDSNSGIEAGAECKGAKSEEIIITNNLLCNNDEVSLSIGSYEKGTGSVENVQIANNTIYHTGTSQVIEINISDKIDFKNNIIYSTSDESIIDTGSYTSSNIKNISFNNNIVYGTENTSFNYLKKEYTLEEFSDFVSGTNIAEDPMFVDNGNDFSLKSQSPCIDKGDNSISSIVGDIDLIGYTRINNTIDIGAYEYK